MLIDGLQIPYGIQPVNPVPVDSWSGPYDSINEALTSIPIEVRYQTMFVRIINPTDGNNLYWFKDGVQDIDLKLLLSGDYEGDIYNLQTGLTQETILRISGDTALNEYITQVQNSIGNGQITVNSGSGLSGSGTFTVNQTGTTTVTLSHADTSSASNVVQDNNNGVVIQDISVLLDTYGHVTGATASTIDLDQRFVNVTGDTITGDLYVTGNITGDTLSVNSATIGDVSNTEIQYLDGLVSNAQDQIDVVRNFTGKLLSSGICLFSGATKTSDTTFSVSQATGVIVKNTGEYALNPEIIYVNYTGQTGLTVNNYTGPSTYLYLDQNSQLQQTNTMLTLEERRNNILLSRIAHPNQSTILNIRNIVDYNNSPMSVIRDMFYPMKLINDGISAYPDGSNLNFYTTAGTLHGLGINYVTNNLNPNTVDIPAKMPASFAYRTQLGGSTPQITNIDPNYYDLNGVITPVSTSGDGNENKSTNQRIFMYADGVLNIQYGQQVYSSLANALAAQQTEPFVKYSSVNEQAILIGLLAVRRNTTALNDPNRAIFTPANMFGESVGGVNGISTTSLQQAYNNSIIPHIITNSILDGVEIQVGTSLNTDKAFKIKNITGDTTFCVDGNGSITGNTINFLQANIGNVTNTEIQYLDGLTGNTQQQINDVFNSIGNGQITVNSGAGLSGSGTFTVNQTGTTTVTLSHADTSSASNVVQDNSNGVVIQDISVLLDTYGHITGATSQNIDLDNRYYTETESDSRFVNTSGDTITGDLYINGTITGNTLSTNSATIGNVSNTEIQHLDGVTSNIQNQINSVSGSIGNGQITVNSGSGLSGSGTFTVNQTGTTTVTLEHADTSSASNIIQDNSNGIVIQDISVLLDTYGHVTGATAATYDLDNRYYTETESDSRFVNTSGDTITGSLYITGTVTGNTLTVNSATIGNISNTEIQYLDGLTGNTQQQINDVFNSIGNGQITVNSGAGLSGSGTFTVNQTGTTTVTLEHADTSSANDITQNNSNGVVIQDISVLLDTYGHVTGATAATYDLDERYYTETESDNRFVNVTGDTITGNLYISGTITGNTLNVNSATIGDVTNTEIQYLSGVTSNIQTQINDIDNEFTNHKHYNLYQPNGVNPFVYTDNGGNLHIDGNIYQSGSTYETHAEQLYTKKDKIILRDGATSGLSTNEYSGIVAKLYDGTNDGQLVFDKDGVARVGDVGSEQPLATRIENPINGQFAYWESGNTRLDFKVLTTPDISNINDLYVKETMIGNVDNINTLFSTSQNYVSGSITIYLNGLKEEFFTETLPNQIQLSEAPTIDYGTSDVVTCTYIRKY